MSIRKALGAVKDQTSIGIAKVSSNVAPDLDVAIVKATSHDDEPADEKYLREILNLTSYSRGYVGACVATVSRRLSKTRDWIVALKSLMLLHRLLSEGDPSFHREILHATRRGTRLLNMSDFRDEAHSTSWDHSAFVRTYALYLDQRLECTLFDRNQTTTPRPPTSQYSDYRDGYGNNGWNEEDRQQQQQPAEERKPTTPLREMKPERVLGKMHQLQQLLDRFLACRPAGAAKNCRLVLIALYGAVRESFRLYADICEILAVLLDRFFDMDYVDCVKSFEAYASAAKQIDELSGFYAWCKDTGVARSSEYPEVQRITDKLLETLEEFMRGKAKRPMTPPRHREELPAPSPVAQDEEPPQDMNSIKALPAPSDYYYEEQPPANVEAVKPKPPQQQQQQETDLLNLKDDAVSATDQSNSLALALFSGPTMNNNTNGSWESFPSQAGGTEVTSAWQNPAAEPGKADWELALVESASNLSHQKATMGGGLDPLLLNGMYDQGVVRQHVNAQTSVGSASSVAMPGLGRSATPVLALPAPDGTVQTIGGDPFAASLSVPPPSYVQMADIEQKQQLLVQEQQLWQQYANSGMQGQPGLAKLNTTYQYQNPAMPYGMPPHNTNGGYYH